MKLKKSKNKVTKPNYSFTPKQIIINNPDCVDLGRLHLDQAIEEAVNVKNNALSKKAGSEWQIAISKYVDVLSANRTLTWYESAGETIIRIATQIKKDVMVVDVKLI